MGKSDKKQAAPSGPVIPPEVLERLVHPPKRGVDGNLSALVTKKVLTGSKMADHIHAQETQKTSA
jgi:hypothetical protein